MTREKLQRWWPALALFVSAALLAGAHAFETFGHYPPCDLCLRQREVHWGIVTLAAVSLAVLAFRPAFARLAALLIALAFLGSAGLAGYHAGVEWKFWPGPQTCAAGPLKPLTAEDVMAALTRKGHGPSCEQAAWRMAGISMAGYNALISLALAGAGFAIAARRRPSDVG